ncbi:conjugal transfer protein TraC [Micromonospora rosaria]|uniref:Conjugal transfer protein TraC n=2 Tax=Micromonospora rosaria TaxID=47874 RepID=A0A136PMF1_9ACTN|nr:conjugal transfer protein TraC [Micromonospora rosaria]
MPSPAALSITPGHVRVGDGYAATFAVCGYPAEVGPAWLDPLLSYPGRIDVAVHVDPVAPQVAAPMLKRQRARLESSRRLDADQGRVGDPVVEAAAVDAADLADRVARGAAKLFDVGIYVTVRARTLDELRTVTAGMKSAAAGVLVDLQPATFRHQQGWVATLPVGVDPLRMRRILDTSALAAAFPLASADLAAPAPGTHSPPDGVLYGVTTSSNGVLVWNRWGQDNHNSVVLARSGAGKSYFVKLEVLRSLYQGTTVSVIDPEDEYAPLAEHVGGAVVQLGQPGVRINPFDLPADTRPDTLTRRGLYLHTLVAVMLGAAPPPAERAALDRAITATYAAAGITADPGTWSQPAPLLRDLAAVLDTDGDPAAGQLAARLAPWTVGNFASLFDGPTSTRAEGHLVVWSLRHLPDELRTVGTLLALDAIWSGIDTPPTPARRRRLVVVDEAWLLMRDGEGSRFLFRMAKAARKRSAGLCVITQDAADVLSTDLGLAVVSNAATQVLMRQSTQSIDAVREAFNLTAGESRLLLSAPRGEGLLVAGRSRIPFRAVGSAAEHAIAVTGIGEAG